MQALYGFFQSDTRDLAKSEKDLFSGIEKIYDLFIYQLAFLIELKHVATVLMEEAKIKHLPTQHDLNPNLKFIENKFINQLENNIHVQREINNRRITWNNEFELVKKVFNTIKTSPEFEKYMNVSDDSFNSHRDFALEMFRESIADFELLNHLYEEKNLHYGDDIYIVNPMIVKMIEAAKESATPDTALMTLYKDKEEDMQFVKDLFRETALRNDEIEKMIGDKTKNWEVERIAMMDVLLMKMAITEFQIFNNIPTKVTLNEYIEISKFYSTPKSHTFINGVLDKAIDILTKSKKIQKVGRGLIE